MEKSETIAKLAEALAAAQAEMSNAQMDSVNPHFKSKYASLASVFNAIKPLSKHGIAVVQSTDIERSQKCLISVKTLLVHTSGEFIETEITLPAESDSPQKIGSTITYARRYSLSAICGIAADEDDDAESAMPKAEKKTEARKPDPKPEDNKPAPKSVVNPAIKQRIESLRKIHTLSAKIGMTPEGMRELIGQIVKRPFKESSELQDAELPQIIDEFEAELRYIEAMKKEAAAGENNEQTQTTGSDSQGDF